MKHLPILRLLLAFALFALVPSINACDDHGHRGSGDLPKQFLAEMDAFNARIGQAFADRDIDTVMACFANTPDVQAVIFGTQFVGQDAIRQATLGAFSIPGALRKETLSVNYTRVGELVLVVGTERDTYTLPDGTTFLVINSIWSDVRKKIDGKWVMLLDHVTMLP